MMRRIFDLVDFSTLWTRGRVLTRPHYVPGRELFSPGDRDFVTR